MKRLFAPLCLVLALTAPVSHAAVAPHVGGLGLKLGVEIALAADAGDPDKWRRRDGDNNNNDDRRDRRDDNNGGDRRGGWGGGGRGGEDRSDNRINRAIAIASSRGHVLDAGQQSGSIFWVRVATDRGRVDLLVDTDSGRIVGER